MTKFIAIKVHYDHRERLPKHLKYSLPPTKEEYEHYLELFATGVGGEGFHECMNFAVPEHGDVPIYLPPTCIPAKRAFEEEFVFFTITYKEDQELSASIIGVHARAKLVDLEGVYRTNVSLDFLDVDLLYHAVSKPDYVTLFTVPISYDYKAGVHSPAFASWGYGLRYLEEQHAQGCSMLQPLIGQHPIEAQRIVVEALADILHAIEPHEVECERAEQCEDAGVATNAARIFLKSGVAHVMCAVFDTPMVANGFAEPRGGQHEVAEVVGALFGDAPVSQPGIESFGMTLYADQRAEMAMPGFAAQARV